MPYSPSMTSEEISDSEDKDDDDDDEDDEDDDDDSSSEEKSPESSHKKPKEVPKMHSGKKIQEINSNFLNGSFGPSALQTPTIDNLD